MDEETVPHGGHLSRPRKRRSWFDDSEQTANQSLSYEIAVEHYGKENVPALPDDIEYLILDHFTAQPKLDFGKVKVGHTKTYTLHVRNPRDYEQTVVIEKFPTKKWFTTESMQFDVAANETRAIRIQWQPEEPAHCREMVRFRVDDTYRLMAYFLGQCPQPPQPKKKKSGVIRSLKPPTMKSRQQASVNKSPARKATQTSGPGNRAVLQPSNRDNTLQRNNQTSKRANSEKRVPSRSHPNRSASCNERILQGGLDTSSKVPLDPRMTMRLSKPKVLPQPQKSDRIDSRMTMRLSKPTVLPQGFDEQTREAEKISSSSSLYSRVGEQTRENCGSKQPRTQPMRVAPRQAESEYMEEVYQQEYTIESTETYTEYVEHCEVTNEVIEITETIETDSEGHETVNIERNILETKTETSDAIASTTEYSSAIYEHEHRVIDRYSSTPKAQALSTDDFPDTPSRRMTFRKDDPSLQCTPVRRDTFHLHEANTPGTPVIKSPDHGKHPHVSRVQSKSSDYDMASCHSSTSSLRLPSPKCRSRARSASPSRRAATPVVVFNDDTNLLTPQPDEPKLAKGKRVGTYTKLNSSLSPQAEITTTVAQSEAGSPMTSGSAYNTQICLSLNDIELPYCSDNIDSFSKRRDPKKLSVISERSYMSRDSLDGLSTSILSDYDVINEECQRNSIPENISECIEDLASMSLHENHPVSIIYEKEKYNLSREDKRERVDGRIRNLVSVEQGADQSFPDTVEDSDVLSLPGSQSSAGEGSVYATAQTSPVHSPEPSSGDEAVFEDSLAHLSPEVTGNATVLENSALMSSLLQQKLQRVASFLRESSVADAESEEGCEEEEESGRKEEVQIGSKEKELHAVGNDSIASSIASPIFRPLPPVPTFTNDIRPKNNNQRIHLDSQKNSMFEQGKLESQKVKTGKMEDFIASVADSPLFQPVPSKLEDATEREKESQEALYQKESIKYQSILGNHGNMNDSIASLLVSPMAPKLPVPTFPGSNTKGLGSKPGLDYKQQPINDNSISELLDASPRALPPVPVFEEKPVKEKVQKEVKQSTVNSMPFRLPTEFAFKYRPSEIPQNPFDMTRSSTIGIHNPGADDSIFADQSSFVQSHKSSTIHPQSFRKSTMMKSLKPEKTLPEKEEQGPCSLRLPSRPSENPTSPFDETTRSSIHPIDPGMEDSIFKDISTEKVQLESAAIISPKIKNSESQNNQERRKSRGRKRNTTYDKGDVLGNEVVATPTQNRTYEKESASDSLLELLNTPQKPSLPIPTFTGPTQSLESAALQWTERNELRDWKSNQAVEDVKPRPHPKTSSHLRQAEVQESSNGRKSRGQLSSVEPIEGCMKNEADLSMEDEPLALQDLVMSPSKDKKGVSVEIRQRLSSTPASVISNDVTTPHHVTPQFLTPSPIGRQSDIFGRGTSDIVRNPNDFNAAEDEFKPGTEIDFAKTTKPGDVRRFSTLTVTKTRPSVGGQFPSSEQDSDEILASESRRFSTLTITKSRPSLISEKIPSVSVPKRALFDRNHTEFNVNAGALSKDAEFSKPSVVPNQKGKNKENDIDKAEDNKENKGDIGVALFISPPSKAPVKTHDKMMQRSAKPPAKLQHQKPATKKKVSPQKRELSTGPPLAARKRFRSEQQHLGARRDPGASSRPGASSAKEQLSASQIVPGKQASNLRLSKTTMLRKQAALGSFKASSKHDQSNLSNASTCSSSSSSNSSRASRRSLKGVPQRKLNLLSANKTALPRHPLLYAAKNIYYDERWMEKQDRGFTKWLNYVLTPADFHLTAKTPSKLDLGALVSEQSHVPVAPTKEQISLRTYSVMRRLNRLRRDACALFTRDHFVAMTVKLEREVNCCRIALRADRNVFADLGLKKNVLDLLLGYNPLWLRVGLEVVYGEMIGLHAGVDVVRLSQFIVHRLLGNPEIAAAYAHPTVPHSYSHGYYEALAQFAVKKFLLLVMFLDLSKTSRLIKEDPCLFCIDAPHKSSKSVLLSFSRDFLAAEGDLVKHLGLLGYRVTYTQSALEEVDYGVTNIAVDLRDGLRLTRVVSQLEGDWSLTSSLRCPAISRLQKLHNVQVALRALTARGVQLNAVKGGHIEAKDVVDGHHEKTLQLLWTLILHFQVEQAIDKQAIEQEITFLRRELAIKKKLAALELDRSPDLSELRRGSGPASELYAHNDTLKLLLRWCRLVCAHYDLHVENFTVSFSDGRALCYLVHHYHPSLIGHVCTRTTQTQAQSPAHNVSRDLSADDSFTFSMGEPEVEGDVEELLENERQNFKQLYEAVSQLGSVPMMIRAADMSATIPDEKVVVTYVTYLCTRLLDLREECRAARVIQAAWRQYVIRHKTENLQARHRAVEVIQRYVRDFLRKRREQRHLAAAVVIQRKWRAHRLVQPHRQRFLRTMSAINTIQRSVRNWLRAKHLKELRREMEQQAATKIYSVMCTIQQRRKFLQKRRAVVTIQSFVRGWRIRREFIRQKRAAVCLQANVKCWLERRRHLKRKEACVKLQSCVRDWLTRKKIEKRNTSALVIQSHFRGLCERRRYNQHKKAVVKIQSVVRCWLETRRFSRQKQASIIIQSQVRGWLERRKLSQQKTAVIKIQSYVRRMVEQRRFQKQKQSAVLIQSYVKSYIERTKYLKLKQATVLIQSHFRSFQTRNKVQQQKQAAVKIQSCIKGWIARTHFQKSKQAAILIQSKLRSWLQRKEFQKQNRSVVVIQSHVRRWLERSKFTKQRLASVKIQSVFKGWLQRKTYQKQQQSAIIIQSRVKSWLERKTFLAKQASAILIQSHVRCFLKLTEFKRQRAACITVQSYIRTWIVRNQITKQQNAATVIQATVRRWIQRTTFVKQKRAIIVIQSCAKTWLQKSKYQEQKLAVVRIQATVRRWLAQTRFQKQKKAAVEIQSHVKAVLARRSFIKQRQAAVFIQSHVKGWLARNTFKNQHVAAVKIQSFFRRWLVRKEFVSKKRAAIVIQCHFRKYQAQTELKRLKTEAKLKRQTNAAILIQSSFKRWREEREYATLKHATITLQSHVRCLLARRSFIKQKNAACVIQSHVRGMLQRKQFHAQNNAIVVIQSFVRRWLRRREFENQRRAAIMIQCHFRKYRAQMELRKLLAEAEVRRQVRAAIVIQSYFKRWREEREYVKLKHATITLQSHVRRLLARRSFIKQKTSACVIQSRVRGWLQRKQFHAQREAVIVIQSFIRSWLTRTELKHQTMAVVVIQSHFRKWDAQKKLRKLKNEAELRSQEKAAVLIQSCFKSWRERRSYQMLKQAAVTLQSHFKRYQIQRTFEKQKLAVTLIQSHVRCWISKTQFQNRKQAIVVLQSHYRAYRDRQIVRLMYKETEAKKEASIRIQSFFKSWREKKNYTAKRKAAVIIQSYFRRRIVQNDFKARKEATILIQSYARMWHERTVFIKRKEAAVRIQTSFRSWLNRKEFLNIRQAALVIQSYTRMLRLWRQFVKQKQAAIVIQSYVRCRTKRTQFLTQKRAVILIQSNYRRYRDQKSFNEMKVATELKRQTNAATSIQACFKCWRERIAYRKQRKAVTVMQSYVRSWLARVEYERKRQAVIRLQSFVRCWRQNTEYRKQKNAAITLQSYVRCFQQRTVYRHQKRAIIVLQSHLRSWIKRRDYLKQKQAAILLQSHVRCKKERRVFVAQKNAAILLQSHFRTWQTRTEFRQKQRSAIVLQSHIRSWLKRITFLKQVKAAVTIQRFMRKYFERKRQIRNDLIRLGATITIQSMIKMHLSRKQFETKKHSVTVIQRRWRRVLYRRHYNRVSMATRTLQQWWRAVLEGRQRRRDYLIRRGAVITLQAQIRGLLCRRRCEQIQRASRVLQRVWRQRQVRIRARQERCVLIVKRTHAARTIQRQVRSYLIRTRRERTAAVCIQSVVRGSLTRWRIQRMSHAAVCIQRRFRQMRGHIKEQKQESAAVRIQRTVRGYLTRRRASRFMAAVVKAQALWRGRQTRRLSTNKKVARARMRIETATQNASGQQTLRERTISALDFLLHMKHVDPLIEALVELDTLTQLLPQCCERLVHVDAVPVLYKLITACNRSEPHVRIITYTLNTLLNVAMYEKTRPYVYLGEQATVVVLVDIISIYRFKKSPIFTRACTLLGVMAQYAPAQQDMECMRTQIEKLRSVYGLVMRRNARDDARKETAARMAALKTCSAPARQPRVKLNLSPAWVLRKGMKREVLDHRQAISFTLQALGFL